MTGPRRLDRTDLAYDSIAGSWEGFVDRYDTDRRIEVLVDDFLGPAGIRGKRCLEVGCGLGFFTRKLASLGPSALVALDISPALIRRLGDALPGVDARTADVLHLDDALHGEAFDVVFSSEMIEHTPDPRRAVAQMCSAVAPGGVLVLSCPNARWRWSLTAATRLRIRRPYHGHENWVSPRDLRDWIAGEGLTVLRAEGIHAVPWQPLPKALLRRFDRLARRRTFGLSVNLAIMAERRRP